MTRVGSIPRRGNKYGAKKQFAGQIFDSKAERDYYLYLLSLQQSGEVTDIRLQPQFELQPSYKVAGHKRSAIKYTADFEVVYADGRREVVDVKGFAARDFSLRKRMFEYRYGVPLTVVKPEEIPRMRGGNDT
ncbi:DUF1064 domain-containing protein [Alicyclobacillus fastidiosus]|uniref:DUF1064 domain-containing protein n=1 Tax=Alicyclobacillus fastidiosus TaxID=392011 RepID=A0ABY6ZIU9_9BACL|nr:DUF1064 domain-containing protein [Alicyclobacillus fastidiosus]WAH42812.1 DUF1064 domain-containing protein [Alicyclobacillus fastidiosus]GMA64736.1 hypothetical protein GCM10025859_51760 [Alicyclobacillus fastidiosus]